jgi:hypothetical protein
MAKHLQSIIGGCDKGLYFGDFPISFLFSTFVFNTVVLMYIGFVGLIVG